MFDIRERMLVLVVAFLLDALFGDPHFLWHPVRAIGGLITGLEKLLRRLFGIRRERRIVRERIAGVVLVLLVSTITVLVSGALLYVAWRVHPYVKTALECVMCYQLLAMRSLATEAKKVYVPLASGDTEQARHAVSMIVGRDTQSLDAEGITKAAVETVAENTSDGVVAPLIFMGLFGACGGFFYKAVNTMDSMVGYKNDTYRYFGTAAAILDDMLNYIPARVSAFYMILSAGCMKLSVKNAWRIFKRDRYKHESPNSAQTEAVCAGALGVKLAGPAYYFGKRKEKPVIGDEERTICPEDILRTIRLMIITSVGVLLTMLLIGQIICFV
ncbi:MAG: adenosylcobinamide-phosphate synthase CbiB [Eubacteriales bacterium]|nr:adenosylcobinamide-phosphate synthase CbiB [Eubacteriales bacterium]